MKVLGKLRDARSHALGSDHQIIHKGIRSDGRFSRQQHREIPRKPLALGSLDDSPIGRAGELGVGIFEVYVLEPGGRQE